MLLREKYKPKCLDELYINKNKIRFIKSLIDIDTLNILFYSTNNYNMSIIINVLLKQYYNNDFNNENILYINSLKDNGISYYRNDVKVFCQTISFKKKKTIVIDDFDTTNEQAQQLIRMYIDNYSNNVNFIINCYNIQKILSCIQSRLNIINIDIDNIILNNVFDKICDNEQLYYNNDVKKFIINNSDKSICKMMNYMDKLIITGLDITLDVCIEICINISYNTIDNYIIECKNKNYIKSIEIINSLYNKGYTVLDIYNYLSNYIINTNNDILDENEKYEIIKILCKYIKIFHNIHENEIELCFLTNNIIKILL